MRNAPFHQLESKKGAYRWFSGPLLELLCDSGGAPHRRTNWRVGKLMLGTTVLSFKFCPPCIRLGRHCPLRVLVSHISVWFLYFIASDWVHGLGTNAGPARAVGCKSIVSGRDTNNTAEMNVQSAIRKREE